MPALVSSRQLLIYKRSAVSDFVLLLPFVDSALGWVSQKQNWGVPRSGVVWRGFIGKCPQEEPVGGGGGKEPEQVSSADSGQRGSHLEVSNSNKRAGVPRHETL